MFAIAFDMSVKLLKEHYGEPYNNAYYEIGVLLKEFDFYNTQGSVYLIPTKKRLDCFVPRNDGKTSCRCPFRHCEERSNLF